MSTARLHGSDHGELGEIAVVGETSAALGISRGGSAKTYAHREPNEDSVGFRLSEWGAVAVVADGHAGSVGARVAVDRVLDHHAERWLSAAPIALDARFPAEAGEVVLDVNTAIVRASTEGEARGSRSTLSVVLLRPGDGWLGVLSVGDSHVFRGTAEGALELAREPGERSTYLGDPAAGAEELRAAVRAEVASLEGVDALVLATDGLSERGIGVKDPTSAVGDVLREAREAPRPRRPLQVARGVVEVAMAAHREQRSGDNIASAVLFTG